MQKNLDFVFVQYLQKEINPFNLGFLRYLQQHPSGASSVEDTAWILIYPVSTPA